MNKNDVMLLTCDNLFIIIIIIIKSSHQVEVQESVDKTAKQFFPPKQFFPSNLTSAKIKRATRLVQSNYYNLFDWTIQTREVI